MNKSGELIEIFKSASIANVNVIKHESKERRECSGY